MPNLIPPSLDEQITAVEREIGFRLRVYPRRVAERKMKQDTADYQIEAMRAVLSTLLFVRDNGHGQH
jgi:hypothetical protein